MLCIKLEYNINNSTKCNNINTIEKFKNQIIQAAPTFYSSLISIVYTIKNKSILSNCC
jgi:hypothetical protein